MAKNIVVCCDGTGNEYGSNNTNVVKLYEAIVRDRDQAAFYDPRVENLQLSRQDPRTALKRPLLSQPNSKILAPASSSLAAMAS